MKIGIVSDLHIDKNNSRSDIPVQKALAQVARERQAELLIVAGDISNNYLETLQVLDEIEQNAGIPCLFVPGNHDIWNIEHPGCSAWSIYEKLQQFERNLTGAPYRINEEWVVIGDIGWYDFTFGNGKFGYDEFEKMEYNNRTWKDKLYANWEKDAPAVADYFYEKLRDQLESYKHNHIILVTHVVPHEHFIVPLPNHTWEYFNAFLGSKRYRELIEEYGKSIKYAVCGHVHYRKRIRERETEFICNCLGDYHEWRYSNQSYQEISKIFATIQI